MPAFDWARNLKQRSLEQDQEWVAKSRFQESSIAAFFWNMAKGSLRKEVVDSYENYMRRSLVPPMGTNLPAGDFRKVGDYAITDLQAADPSGKFAFPQEFSFKAVDRAPPCAIFTVNYAR